MHTRVLSTLLNEMDGVVSSAPRPQSGSFNDGVAWGSGYGGGGGGGGGSRGVLVLAATNRRDALDAALLRPGRLHESVEFGMPGKADREGVLRVHAQRLPLATGVDLERLSRDDVSGGLSCADLEVRKLGRNKSNVVKCVDLWDVFWWRNWTAQTVTMPPDLRVGSH